MSPVLQSRPLSLRRIPPPQKLLKALSLPDHTRQTQLALQQKQKEDEEDNTLSKQQPQQREPHTHPSELTGSRAAPNWAGSGTTGASCRSAWSRGCWAVPSTSRYAIGRPNPSLSPH
eukprot:163488-Rhodomonas_salina.1